MKLSKETLDIMKNFATINGNLMIKEGNVLTTMTAAKNVYASAKVSDTFTRDFGIYDTGEFLSAITSFDDATVEFGEKFATISEGESMSRYFRADDSILIYPQKEINLPDFDIKFDLTEKQISTLLKWTGVYRTPDLIIKSDDGKIVVSLADVKNSASNTFEMVVGETDKDFSVTIKVEKLKLILDKYTVSLSEKIISFEGNKVHYIIAADV